MNIARALGYAIFVCLAPVAFVGPAFSLPGGEVHGSVLALIRGAEAFPLKSGFVDRDIFLPDIGVFLKNTATNAVTRTWSRISTGPSQSPHSPKQPINSAGTQTVFKPDAAPPLCFGASTSI